jgi:hypothetical protein
MVKRTSHPIVLLLVYGLIAAGIWLAVMNEFRLDDSFITYRYARNLAQGVGLVYNPGETVLSTTAPLYAILLAGLSLIVPDFHVLGSLIGVVSIVVGGWMVSRLAERYLSSGLRLWAGLVYVLSSPLWLALGMETALWIGLVLAGIDMAQRERWGASGLLIGLAMLVRPDAALPGALLFAVAVFTTAVRFQTTRKWWQPVVYFPGSAAVPLVLFAGWAMLTYGSPIPVTLGAKGAQAELGITGLGVGVTAWEGLRLILRSLMEQSPLYVVVVLLALFGAASSLPLPVVIVVGWGALHLLAYMVLGVAPYRWYYAPLVPGAALLAAYGLQYLQGRLSLRGKGLAVGLVGVMAVLPLAAQGTTFSRIAEQMRLGGPTDVMLPIVDWKIYQETGEWLNQNAPVEATVGVAEVGQLGFYARRWMTDYLGLLQPEASAMLRRGDLYSWLIRYAPDYLVFQRFRGAALVLYNLVIEDDPWFRANYQEAAEFDDPRYASGPVTIFSRKTRLGEMEEQAVQLDFEGLRLVGYASDGGAIPAEGGPVRVRLDWEVAGELPDQIHVAVKGVGMAGTNPGFDGDYATENWTGQFSTWHGFVIPEGVEAGSYTLLVAVGPTGGPYLEEGVGEIEVTES